MKIGPDLIGKFFMGEVEVSKDLDGQVVVAIGGVSTRFTPPEAMRFGAAILRAAGCKLAFDGDPKTKMEAGL